MTRRLYASTLPGLLGAGLQLVVQTAIAADTIEAWDHGASDVDFYVGLEGLNANGSDQSLNGDMMFGYGLGHRVSVFLGLRLQATHTLNNAQPDLYYGLFGTAVDTDHIDVDILMTLRTNQFSQLEIVPAFELNFDLDPAMRSWGAYLRSEMVLHGHSDSATELSESRGHPSLLVALTAGTYLSVAQGHQLLIEYDVAWHPAILMADERRFSNGGLAMGYNVVLSDTVEVITQVYWDLPQQDEVTSWGLMTGLIATLPSSDSP